MATTGTPFVVMQVLFEQRVIRGNQGRALLPGESKPRIVREKGGVDMHHVELALSERGEGSAQTAEGHDAILRVPRHGSSRHSVYRWIGRFTRIGRAPWI